MTAEPKKKDWAAISDDDDESDGSEELSPREEEQGSPVDYSEQKNLPEEQGENPEEKIHTGGHRDVARPINDKAEMISTIQSVNLPRVYLNLYNMNPETTEEEIRQFYHPIIIDEVLQRTNMFDLGFTNKDEAIKVIEKGPGTIRNTTFQMRIGIKTIKAKDYAKKYDKKDKPGRNYGPKDPSKTYNNEKRGYGNYEQKDQRNNYGQGKGNYGGRKDDNTYWEKRGEQQQQGGQRKPKEQQSYKTEYVRKEQEIKKEVIDPEKEAQLPKEWEDAWKKRPSQNEIPDEEPEKTTEETKEETSPKKGQGQSQGQGQGYRKRDNYQGGGGYERKGDYERRDYYNKDQGQGYQQKREEYKEGDIVKKGRGQTKYGKEHTLEQDKILQVRERQDSYKSQGSGKGSYNQNKGQYQDEYVPKKYNNPGEKWTNDKGDYYNDKRGGGNKGRYEEGNRNNDKGGSRVYYTQKMPSEGTEGKKYYVEKKQYPQEQGKDKQQQDIPSSPELKKRASQNSKNTANPFNLLQNN